MTNGMSNGQTILMSSRDGPMTSRDGHLSVVATALRPALPIAVLVAALLASPALPAEPDGAVPPIGRIAILAAPAQRGLADLLTAELSKQSEFTLVERESIARVVDELALSAARSGDGAAAVKLGGLLAADAILFVEPEPGSEPPRVRLEFVETRTGIRLGDWPVAAAGIEAADMADAVGGMRQAGAKLGVRPGDRHLIGSVGIEPELESLELRTLARALTALVERDLADMPAVVMLERKQLRRLAAERDLTGLELDLKGASKLIEGSLRRDGDRLAVAVKLVPLTGGEGRTVTASASGDLPAIRRELMAALAAALGAEPRGRPAAAPAEESALLAARARRLMWLRDYAEAVRLAEAAHVLEANPQTFQLMCSTYNGLMGSIDFDLQLRESQPDYRPPWFDRERYPTVEAARLAQAEIQLRLSVAARDYYERCVGDPKMEGSFPVDPYAMPFKRLPLSKNDEERRLLDEKSRLHEELYRRILEVRRAAGGPKATLLLLQRLQRFDGVLESKTEGAAQAVLDILRETDAELTREEREGRLLGGRLQSLHAYYETLNTTLHAQCGPNSPLDAIRPYLDSLVASDDPSLRMIGWGRLVELPGDAGAAAARQLIDTLLFADVKHYRPGWLGHVAGKRLDAAGLLTPYLETIVARAEDAEDVSPLLAAPRHLVGVISADPQHEADFFRRIVGLIAAKAHPADMATPAEDFRRSLESIRQMYKPPEPTVIPRAAAGANRLADYEVRDLRITNPEPGFNHLAMVHVDRSPHGDPQRPVVLIWSKHPARPGGLKKDGPPEAEYLIGRVGTEGGAMKVDARCGLPLQFIDSMTTDGQRYFFATPYNGLAVVTSRGRTLIGEAEGVPGEVRTVAWLDGRLYAEVADGLIAIDPDAKTSTTIASGRAAASRTPLDGVGAFSIRGLVADPPRKRLLMLVNTAHPTERNGLWSFIPHTGDWRCLDGGADGGYEDLGWAGAGALCYVSRKYSHLARIVRLDLETSQLTTLPAGYVRGGFPASNRPPSWAFMDDLQFSAFDARDASGIRHDWPEGAGSHGDSVQRIGDELVVFGRYSGPHAKVIRRKKPPGVPGPTP